jgi:hypothetical protein
MRFTGQLTLISERSRRSPALVLLFSALLLGTRVTAAAPADPAAPTHPASRFDLVVSLVAGDAGENRSAFAEAALLELASIYLAEADLARNEATDSSRPYKLLRWSGAVERYADELLLALAKVQHGAEVGGRSRRGAGTPAPAGPGGFSGPGTGRLLQ